MALHLEPYASAHAMHHTIAWTKEAAASWRKYLARRVASDNRCLIANHSLVPLLLPLLLPLQCAVVLAGKSSLWMVNHSFASVCRVSHDNVTGRSSSTHAAYSWWVCSEERRRRRSVSMACTSRCNGSKICSASKGACCWPRIKFRDNVRVRVRVRVRVGVGVGVRVRVRSKG
jgi:hypothetical protein